MMQTKEQYLREKEAAKLVAFYEALEHFIALYIELKRSYPALAETVENEHPFLRSLSRSAGEEPK